MQRFVAALFVLLALAGCSDAPKATDEVSSSFDDLGIKATATTGVLLGVVVDEAIRPLAGAKVAATGPDAVALEKTTDSAGRFAFADLTPGTYFLAASLLNYQSAQTSAEVVAGDDEPRAVRVQLARLFDQNPFSEQFQFDGFLACSISFPVGTTCVNDYTRLVPQCNGGCLRDYELAKTAGNIREYVYTISPGWQAIISETTWERTSEVSSEQLTLSLSYYSRPSASHFYGNEVSANPLYHRIDLGKEADGQNGDPALIPPEGTNEFFAFFNAGGGQAAINQAFRHFQHTFYYGLPPDDWSFIAGHPLPF